MDINNLNNCTMTTYAPNDKILIYDFIADSGYCFRKTSELQENEDGKEYYDHFTAFSLLADEIDTLQDYECVKFEEGMVIH